MTTNKCQKTYQEEKINIFVHTYYFILKDSIIFS